MTPTHVPVLADEVTGLATGAERVVDGTAGLGGHTARFRWLGASVLAVDRDARALASARAALPQAGVAWLHGRFGDPTVLAAVRRFRPDFVLLDLGVSSYQLDTTDRGFSFRPAVPLDMRMEGDAGRGVRAADLLNTYSETELAQLFRDYGDEPKARRLAKEIVRRRDREPFATSDQLVNAIRAVLGPRSGPSDFARLFQAVRIAVNDERGELERALPALRDALVPGGTLAVISYHSGEDRTVKHLFREWARACVCPPAQPVCTCRGKPLGTLRPRKPIRPSAAEVARNPRARSAKLRGFRVDAAA